MHDTPPTHIGVSDTARILGKSVRTVHRMVAAGKLPAVKLPGRTGAFALDRAEVEKLAEQAA